MLTNITDMIVLKILSINSAQSQEQLRLTANDFDR